VIYAATPQLPPIKHYWLNLEIDEGLSCYFSLTVLSCRRCVPGISRGLHCDQPDPRQYNAPMAGNPCNPGAPTQSSRHLSHGVNSRDRDGRGAERRQQTDQRCAGNCSIL